MLTLRVFVSHSHQDNDWCEFFVDALRQKGVNLWFDRQGLYVGAQWIKTLEQEIQARDLFLIILTPASWQSEWVQEELALALGQRKQIIGVIHLPTQLDGFITSRQLLDVVGQEGGEAANAVYQALEALPAQNDATTPPVVNVAKPQDDALGASTGAQASLQENHPKYYQLGQLLKEHRQSRRINQAVLASKLGVSLPVIAQFELGVRLPSPSTIRYIGEAMQLTDEEIEQLIQLAEQLQHN